MSKRPLTAIMWFLDAFYRAVSHRVTVTVLLLSATAVGVYFCDFLKSTLTRWTIFSRFEVFAVILAFILSQFSYGTSITSIALQQTKLAKETDKEDDEYRLKLALFGDQSFALLNLGFFILAICFVAHPLWHILFIQTVLFAFSANNLIQKSLALKLKNEAIRHGAVIRAMDMHHWLFSENGPGVFGYFLVIVLLTVFGLSRNVWFDQTQGEHFRGFVEAFTAGVAGYQISLSTVVYFFFHRFSTGRAFEFEGFAKQCNDENLINHIRKKMGPRWFIVCIVITPFVLSWVMISIVRLKVGF
jgi:hypothetical protein